MTATKAICVDCGKEISDYEVKELGSTCYTCYDLYLIKEEEKAQEACHG